MLPTILWIICPYVALTLPKLFKEPIAHYLGVTDTGLYKNNLKYKKIWMDFIYKFYYDLKFPVNLVTT